MKASVKAVLLGIPALAVLFALLAAGGAAERPDEPSLRVQIGVHNADLTGLAVDRDGDLLATASFDRTLRFWSAADPSAPARIVRMPLSDDPREGKLYTVALSPDGRFAATGGWTSVQDKKDGRGLSVFDTATGEMLRRISLSGRALSLAFSPNEPLLAVGLKDKPGVALFSTENWQIINSDDNYYADVPSIDMDSRGRVAAVTRPGVKESRPGTIELYQPGLRQEQRQSIQTLRDRPAIIRFSPDGSVLAVGYSDAARVDLFSADKLAPLGSAEGSRTDKGYIALTWSRDGEYLYGAGENAVEGRSPIRRWSQRGRGPGEDFWVAQGRINRLQALPDGRLAFTTQAGMLGVLDASMTPESPPLQPAIVDFRNQAAKFLVSADGRRVRFDLPSWGKDPWLFDVSVPELSPADTSSEDLSAADTKSLPISWLDEYKPRIGAKELALEPLEMSRSVAIAPDKESFVLGTEFGLLRFSKEGKELWRQGTPGVAWAVNIAQDGRLVIAAFSDGSIRWYRSDDGKELLALFVYVPEKPDADKRWILWTADGYFNASPGGEDLIVWHVDRGPDKAADFFTASRFREQFYRPDIVDQVLATLDAGEATRRANLQRTRVPVIVDAEVHSLEAAGPMLTSGPRVPADITTSQLPIITMRSHRNGTAMTSNEITVRFNIRSPAGLPIRSVFARVDGQDAGELILNKPMAQDETFDGQLKVRVPPRDIVLKLFAKTKELTSDPATANLHWLGPDPRPSDDRPMLHALLIGAGHYEKEESLGDAPANDVDQLVWRLNDQKGRAFRDVRLHLLKDRQTADGKDISATKSNILQALQRLKKATQDQDGNVLALVFFAGHGKTIDGDSFLLAIDYDPDDFNNTTIEKGELLRLMQSIRGSRLLILDACYAAHDVIDIVDLGNGFRQAPNFVTTLASSGRAERSYDDGTNGYFTRALTEVLDGNDKEAADDGNITTTELLKYARRRVKDMISRTDMISRNPQNKRVQTPQLFFNHDDLRLGKIAK
jgi:WD40 repeat protein